MAVAEEDTGGNILEGEDAEDEHRHQKLEGRRQPDPVPLDLLLPKAQAPRVRLFLWDLPMEDHKGIMPATVVREKCLEGDKRTNWEAKK